jgi:hypothetical protein
VEVVQFPVVELLLEYHQVEELEALLGLFLLRWMEVEVEVAVEVEVEKVQVFPVAVAVVVV